MKHALAALALLLGVSTAGAADMPLKAAPLVSVDGFGAYMFLAVGGGVSRANVSGSGLFAQGLLQGDMTASGGTIGGGFGWLKGNDNFSVGGNFAFDYSNITGAQQTAVGDAGVASRWSAMQTIRFSGNDPLSFLQTTLGNLGVQGFTFPTFTPPVGAGALAATPRTFFGFGLREAGIRGNIGNATGVDFNVAPAIEFGATWQALNLKGLPTGNAIEVLGVISWPGKGKDFNNFGTSQLALVGEANMGTYYGFKTAYKFGVPSSVYAYAR